ncbi:MAG TPA: hypothetical protein VIK53_06465 [Verrucomicrobiae bacterium]
MFGLMLAVAARAQMIVQVGQNFVGSNNSQTRITPADGNGAVGPRYFVEFINGAFAVYNKTNGARVLQISDLKFWSNGGPDGNGDGLAFSSWDTISDPRVIYDPVSQRWFASQVDYDGNVSDPTYESDYYLLAVSDTADPTGAWHAFSFLADPESGNFADFPTLGVDASAVYLAGDMFYGGNSLLGTSLTMIPKADLLASSPVVTNRIFFGTTTYAERGAVLQPVTCLDGSSSGNILAAGDLGFDFAPHSNLVASTVLNPGTAAATLAPATNIFVDAYTVPIDPVQPDGSDTLADNDARFSAGVITVGGMIYAVHNIEVNGRAAIRWYRIKAANYALLESGTISDPVLDLFYPSIAVNTNGVVVIGCNGSSIKSYISSYAYVGLTEYGATTFGNAILLAAGGVNYHDLNELYGVAGESRWGDYSTVSVDPSDPSRFWTIQMLPSYDSSVGSGDLWRMQITELITTLPVPRLIVALSGSYVKVSWPAFASAYQLQSTTNLTAGGNWLPVGKQKLTNDGNTISMFILMSGPQEFFRLVKSE